MEHHLQHHVVGSSHDTPVTPVGGSSGYRSIFRSHTARVHFRHAVKVTGVPHQHREMPDLHVIRAHPTRRATCPAILCMVRSAIRSASAHSFSRCRRIPRSSMDIPRTADTYPVPTARLHMLWLAHLRTSRQPSDGTSLLQTDSDASTETIHYYVT